ncbi:MAG: complex I NDUFA9 subunit family protein [Candidatus Eiseniibacteriota bacterium]
MPARESVAHEASTARDGVDDVLVAGASGYLGSRLVPRLLARGHRVRALVRGGARRAARIPHLEGCEIADGDLFEPASLLPAARGMRTVVHLVGILKERGPATFESVHVNGTAALVQAAREGFCERFLYVSAIGARRDAPTAYWRTKFRAEEMVRNSGLEWLILRPSIVFARDGEFYSILSRLVAIPLVPVLGPGTSRLAPIPAGDLADIEVAALSRSGAWNAVHAVCGAETYTFNELLRAVARGRRRPAFLVHVPLALARPLVRLAGALLPDPPVTSDQVAMLAEDSICPDGPESIARAFGVRPGSIAPILAGEKERAH